MWWDVYVPKVVADEHVREITHQWERLVAEKNAEITALRLLEARLNEIENSVGWKAVLKTRRICSRFVRRDSRFGRLALRAAHVWLQHGTLFTGFAAARKTTKAALRRLRFVRPDEAAVDSSAPEVAETTSLPIVIDAHPPCDHIAAPDLGPETHKRLLVTPAPDPALHLYTSSLGNYFFEEIRDVIAAGLRQLGLIVHVHDEAEGFCGRSDDWHLVLAPHEFFYLGAGQQLGCTELPVNLILINTEQPHTQWFRRAADFFPKARWIWDIDYLSAQRLSHRGWQCRYLPLGFVPHFHALAKQRDLPLNYGTCFLEPQVRFRSRLEEPLSVRPIDVAFFGNTTYRREMFFSRAAAVFAKHRCYFHFSDGSKPLLQGQTTYMNTPTVVGIVQRAKVLLNIHRDEDSYFESHRIVMHGISQKGLVISEPCSPSPPFRPGIDFVEATLDEIPSRVEYYLTDPVGRREAQEIADQGYRTLSRDCQLKDVLTPLVAEFTADIPNLQAGMSATPLAA